MKGYFRVTLLAYVQRANKSTLIACRQISRYLEEGRVQSKIFTGVQEERTMHRYAAL